MSKAAKTDELADAVAKRGDLAGELGGLMSGVGKQLENKIDTKRLKKADILDRLRLNSTKHA